MRTHAYVQRVMYMNKISLIRPAREKYRPSGRNNFRARRRWFATVSRRTNKRHKIRVKHRNATATTVQSNLLERRIVVQFANYHERRKNIIFEITILL